MSDIVIPWAYSDAIHTPEGKLWKDVMDYELAKLEEMNTWSEINEGDVPQGEQVLPGERERERDQLKCLKCKALMVHYYL